MAPSKKSSSTARKKSSTGKVAKATTPAPVPAPPYPGRELEEGMRSHLVATVQEALGVKVDGWYGRKTLEAVAAFQAKNKMQVSGNVGKTTWSALFK